MKIQKVFLILSILGICLLIFLSQIISPKTIKMDELEKSTLKNKGEKIQIQGEIEKINYYENKVSIYLKGSEVEFVIFTENFQQEKMKKQEKMKILGEIDFYKNQLQVIVDKLEVY